MTSDQRNKCRLMCCHCVGGGGVRMKVLVDYREEKQQKLTRHHNNNQVFCSYVPVCMVRPWSTMTLHYVVCRTIKSDLFTII